jgi:menaquinone-dependent protoporphyrinogen oxidase
MLICFATRDGHSRRIAERLGGRLRERGVRAELRDLAQDPPAASELDAAVPLVVVAAVRYGRTLPEAERFLATVRIPTLALISVNLTARKPGKDGADSNPYLRKLIARHRLDPAIAAAIGGRLNYRSYRWFDRQMIRFIMLLTGGPADGKADVDYTDWNRIDALAARIAELRAATR